MVSPSVLTAFLKEELKNEGKTKGNKPIKLTKAGLVELKKEAQGTESK